MRRYISAYILDAPYHIDKTYDYYIPEQLEGEVSVGSIVSVPFGVSNRRTLAVTAELKNECEYKRVKPVLSVTDNRFALSEHLLRLCLFMKEHTLCTVGEAVRSMLPSAAFSKAEQILLPAKGITAEQLSSLSEIESAVADFVLSHPNTTQKKLTAELGAEAESVAARLIRKQMIVREYTVKENTNNVYKTYILPCIEKDEARLIYQNEPDAKVKLRSEKQRELLRCVTEAQRIEKGLLLSSADATPAQLKSLIDKGLVCEEKEEEYRNPYKDIKIDSEKKNILSDSQREAFLELASLYHEKGAHAALL